MDIHGNVEGQDVMGSIPTDTFGVPSGTDGMGNLPSDVLGNPEPGGIIETAIEVLGSIFGL